MNHSPNYEHDWPTMHGEQRTATAPRRPVTSYNDALRLFLVDDQLKRLVDAYCDLGHVARGALAREADRLLAADPRPAALEPTYHPAVARGIAAARLVVGR